jgi:hypothetical protein
MAQTCLAERHLVIEKRLEAQALARRGDERPDRRHIADHVDQFAIDGRGARSELQVTRPALLRQPEQEDRHADGNPNQRERHPHTHPANEHDGPHHRKKRRQRAPCGGVFNREERICRCRDAARQGARLHVREIGGRMTDQVAEQFAAHVPRHCHERKRNIEAGHLPRHERALNRQAIRASERSGEFSVIINRLSTLF